MEASIVQRKARAITHATISVEGWEGPEIKGDAFSEAEPSWLAWCRNQFTGLGLALINDSSGCPQVPIVTKELGSMCLKSFDDCSISVELTSKVLDDGVMIIYSNGLRPLCSSQVSLAIGDGDCILPLRMDPCPACMALCPGEEGSTRTSSSDGLLH